MRHQGRVAERRMRARGRAAAAMRKRVRGRAAAARRRPTRGAAMGRRRPTRGVVAGNRAVAVSRRRARGVAAGERRRSCGGGRAVLLRRGCGRGVVTRAWPRRRGRSSRNSVCAADALRPSKVAVESAASALCRLEELAATHFRNN